MSRTTSRTSKNGSRNDVPREDHPSRDERAHDFHSTLVGAADEPLPLIRRRGRGSALDLRVKSDF